MGKRLLSKAYTHLWVPLFGRILFLFVQYFEGKKPNDHPSFNIKYTESEIDNE